MTEFIANEYPGLIVLGLIVLFMTFMCLLIRSM